MSLPRPQVVSFDDESLVLVDADDQIIGHAAKAQAHDGHGLLHRAFSVFLFDDHGQVLLQQRSAQKRLWPLYWSNTCCSHPRGGEGMADAGHRRLREELGVRAQIKFVYKFTYQADFGSLGAEHEMCSVFVGRLKMQPQPNPNEIAAVQCMAPAALDQALANQPQRYTPWLHLEWAALRRQYWQICGTLP